MHQPWRWDVVVAGAGPAGSTTAALLARHGYRTLLIDRARFPREKPCSDFVAPGARPVLDRLGLLDILERCSSPIHGMEITSPSGVTLRGHYAAGNGFGIPRRELDAMLVERAVAWGATLWDESRVSGLRQHGSLVQGVVVRRGGRDELVDARVVVGADGLRSVVARSLGRNRRVGERRLALVAQLAGVAGLHGVGEIFVGPRGYAGVAPLPRGAANVAVVLRTAVTRRGQSAERLFWNELAGFPSLYQRVHGSSVLRRVLATGPFGWRSEPVTNGAILVGDAAAFFDPITGDGVSAALSGGALAADTIARALEHVERPNRAALASYRTARRRLFGARWIMQRMLGVAIQHPTLFDVGLRRLASHGNAGDRIVRLAGAMRTSSTGAPMVAGGAS